MKNRKTILLITVLALIALLLSACSGNGENKDPNAGTKDAGGQSSSTVKLTFDLNYDGAPAAAVVEAVYGEYPEEPAAPVRSGYAFEGWYTDKACTDEADFTRVASKDATYYAKWRQTDATVVFDENREGGKTSDTKVALGQTVARPSSPEYEGYLFEGWFTDKEGTKEYDFDTAVSGDFTLYAKWTEDLGDNVAITYMWNYEGAPDGGRYDKVVMEKNKKPKLVQASREGYYFAGWCTDPEGTEYFDAGKRLNQSVTLYAKWLTVFTFEAEYIDVSEIHGMGYSGNADGLGVIERDVYNMNASNGYYVGWLYDYGIELVFNLKSDKAVSDACLALSLSGEFSSSGTIIIKSDEFTVEVNGEALSYVDITIDGVTDGSSDQKRAFSTFLLSTHVSLKEGDNVIRLVVTNHNKGEGGTMYATAPMVDCLKIYSDAEVTWGDGFPLESNIRR